MFDEVGVNVEEKESVCGSLPLLYVTLYVEAHKRLA